MNDIPAHRKFWSGVAVGGLRAARATWRAKPPLARVRSISRWRRASPLFAGLVASILVAGCGTYPGAASAMFDGSSQVQARSYQTRAYDTTDREKMLRGVVATLQDLGFIIDKADATLGTVTASKLATEKRQPTLSVRASVTVRPRGATQLLVRMNAQYSIVQAPNASRAIDDPAAYQDFFTALSKSLFLEAQQPVGP